ncbi:MAG: alpha/beta hydrolase [Gammaproteobacteria bacterium]|nr:MAG: alpha/beta hydrolase [Gammaproteobacteria bacterium]
MTEYSDLWYESDDGLRLYARDYACTSNVESDAPLMLCMHGLTRNSADFHGFALQMRGHYRVVAVDQRGRGRSAYDPNPENYAPPRYVQDMATLLEYLKVEQVILVGTSMGGLMAMMMAALFAQRLAAVVINDIGPDISPVGLERIKGYVGQLKPAANWGEAVAQAKLINQDAFPDFSDAQWQAFTQGIYRLHNGTPVLAYDPAISQPFRDQDAGAEAPDLWPIFDALKPIPTLLVRGALSDLLEPACVEKMRERKPDLQFVEMANRGHAPMLVEAEALTAISEFLRSQV